MTEFQTTKNTVSNTGALSWMARNPVAANLLMLFLLVAGFNSMRQVKQEIFPEFALDSVEIFVSLNTWEKSSSSGRSFNSLSA